MSIGFMGCWAPYGLMSLWSILKDSSSSSIPPEVSLLPCMFAKSSTIYNPMIYYIFSQSFQMEVKQLCSWCLGSNMCSNSNSININNIYMTSCEIKPRAAARTTLQEIPESSMVIMG